MRRVKCAAKRAQGRMDENVKAVNCASRKIHVLQIFVAREEQRVRARRRPNNLPGHVLVLS